MKTGYMQNILSFKEFYLKILEENFIVIDEISSFDSLFTNIGYIVSFYIYIGMRYAVCRERYADNICLKDISRPCLICKAKWDNGRSSILMILCSWWLIGGRGCLPLDPHQVPVLCILHKGW